MVSIFALLEPDSCIKYTKQTQFITRDVLSCNPTAFSALYLLLLDVSCSLCCCTPFPGRGSLNRHSSLSNQIVIMLRLLSKSVKVLRKSFE